jgi:hypothetical protein
MTPLAEAVFGKTAKPYIVCYTDVDDLSPVTGFAELYNGETRSLALVMEIGVANAVKNMDNNIVLNFSATDEGLEFAVDVVETQAIAALVGDPRSEWGDLLKRMIRKISRMPSRRGGQADKGVRFAARRTTLVVSTIFDIMPGVLPDVRHPVWDFIKLARKHPEVGMVDSASIIEGLLNVENAPTWRQAQAYLGLPNDAIRALNPDGTPLPLLYGEVPPLERDPDEFVPGLNDIEAMGTTVSPLNAVDLKDNPPILKHAVIDHDRSHN